MNQRTLLTFSLLLIALAAFALTGCAPSQNAVVATPTHTLATATVPPTATPLPTSTPTTPASATTAGADVTPRPTATHTPRPTATFTPTPLPTHVEGTVVSFSNGILTVHLSPITSDGSTVQIPVSNQINVFVPTGATYSLPVADPMGALTTAARDHVSAELDVADDNTVKDVVFEFPPADVAAFPTVDAQAVPTLTPTPAGFVPTPTPVAMPWMADMPWGRVDLNIPIDQSNVYAMTVRCWRQTTLIDASLLHLWATNPNGIYFGHPNTRTDLEVKVIGKDMDWSVNSQGQKYFNAYVESWQTPLEAAPHRFVLQIFYNAPLATNMPVDSRLGSGAQYTVNYAPVPTMLTDINQIHIGQIYEVIEGYLSWGGVPAVDDHFLVSISQAANNLLGIFTIPVATEGTCAYFKDMMDHGYFATPVGDDYHKW
jgi:hypothetical protein